MRQERQGILAELETLKDTLGTVKYSAARLACLKIRIDQSEAEGRLDH